MAGIFSYKDAEKEIKGVLFTKLAKELVKRNGLSLRELSKRMGLTEIRLSQQLRAKKIDIVMVQALCHHLRINLYQFFINTLPGDISPTLRETALQNTIQELEKKLADMEKERDLYKEILMK